jgi:hypothetical protein
LPVLLVVLQQPEPPQQRLLLQVMHIQVLEVADFLVLVLRVLLGERMSHSAQIYFSLPSLVVREEQLLLLPLGLVLTVSQILKDYFMFMVEQAADQPMVLQLVQV